MADTTKYALILLRGKLNTKAQTITELNKVLADLGLQRSADVREAWVAEEHSVRTRNALPTIILYTTSQRANGLAVRKLNDMKIETRFTL